MASIRKRNTSWEYTITQVIDGTRKRIIKGGFNTKKEAQIAALEVENSLNKGYEIIVKEKAFSELFKDWIELYKSNKHINTYERYLNSYDRVNNYFLDKPVQKITRNDYQQFLNQYGTGKSKESVRKLNTHVRACVKDLIEEGYLQKDFTRKVELNGSKLAKKGQDKHLNYLESIKLYEYLLNNLKDSLSYYIILLALVTGMRFGEIVGLTTDCFDFKQNKIKTYRSWDYKHGTGFMNLKNDQSIRIVSVDKRVMTEFKKLLLKQGPQPNDLIFHKNNSVGSITNEGVNKALKKILKEIGLNTISIHGLRHTHASVLLYKGANINSVSKRLGHADIQTTLDHYAHVLKEMELRDEKIATDIYNIN